MERQTEQRNNKQSLDPKTSRETSDKRPKSKRRQNDESQSMSNPIAIEKIPMRSGRETVQKPQTQTRNREVESVKHLRKRKNHHEYLVKWKNMAKKQWIERDIMIAKHPQSVIAYLQTLVDFRWSQRCDAI